MACGPARYNAGVPLPDCGAGAPFTVCLPDSSDSHARYRFRSDRRHCHCCRPGRHWRRPRVVRARRRGGRAAADRRVVRAAASAAPCELRAVPRRARRAARPRDRAVFPRAAFVHRRARAGTAGAWRTDRDAAAAAALPGCRARLRAAARAAGRVHAARVPERQARSRAGRGCRRPDRGEHRSGGALGPGARSMVRSRGRFMRWSRT